MDAFGGKTAVGWLETASASSPPPASPDSHLEIMQKTRNKGDPKLRHSALACAISPTRKLEEDAQMKADRERQSQHLRQSALSADCAEAKTITTMENANVDAMLIGIAAVIRAYIRESAATMPKYGRVILSGRPEPPKSRYSSAFDEDMHPIDHSGAWRRMPAREIVEAFVRRVVVALELDESSVVLGLILLERALASEPPFHLSVRNWRPTLLMAIVVASKVVYDEKVYLADYREQLPQYNLKHAPQQELAFLELINYNTTVRRGQYAKYYYALEVRCTPHGDPNNLPTRSAIDSFATTGRGTH